MSFQQLTGRDGRPHPQRSSGKSGGHVISSESLDMVEATGSSSRTGNKRGRRPRSRVPCDECIARASERAELSPTIELCENCTASLRRPHLRKALEQALARKGRQQRHAVGDSAFGIAAGPDATPWSTDQQEQHALSFFVKHSAPQLAGYFDSPFWQKMVLQAGHHEPSVRHALAAIGSLHEKLLNGSIDPSQSRDARIRFALEQCNKSITYLVRPELGEMKKPDLRLMLTTCVLFTCFEALQGNCEQAIIHATQGYSLLQQHAVSQDGRQRDVDAFAVEMDQLSLLMRRLQTQSKGLMASGKDFNIIPEADSIENSPPPSSFSSLRDARASLETKLNHLTVFFMDTDLDDHFYDLAVSNAEKHLIFGPWLSAWETAFSSYLSQNQAGLSDEDRRAAMVLKAHHLVADILMSVDLSMGELGWDALHDKFEAIVDLATSFLQGTSQGSASTIEARWKTNGVFISAPSATLSFSLGIVDPLYEVAARCRDPSLRRRALDLLAKHPRQEGMWSSWSAWKVGKFIMRMEEEASPTPPRRASDVPADKRVSEAWFDFSDKSTEEARKGLVSYKRAMTRANARYYASHPAPFALEAEPSGFTYHKGPHTPGPGDYATPAQSSATQASYGAEWPEEAIGNDFDASEESAQSAGVAR